MDNKEELESAFTDVRKAYRLLYKYQKRVLDLVEYIGVYFSYSYRGGFPWFSNPSPNRGKGRLDLWSWDWLNMYRYAFNFGKKSIDNQDVYFEIQLVSDTGYYDVKANENKISKGKLSCFGDVRESETLLILIASNKGWNKEIVIEVLNGLTKDKREYLLQREGVNIIAKTYKLSAFLNEESTIEQLFDFSLFCEDHKIRGLGSNVKEYRKDSCVEVY